MPAIPPPTTATSTVTSPSSLGYCRSGGAVAIQSDGLISRVDPMASTFPIGHDLTRTPTRSTHRRAVPERRGVTQAAGWDGGHELALRPETGRAGAASNDGPRRAPLRPTDWPAIPWGDAENGRRASPAPLSGDNGAGTLPAAVSAWA